jgi:hypothetical protein
MSRVEHPLFRLTALVRELLRLVKDEQQTTRPEERESCRRIRRSVWAAEVENCRKLCAEVLRYGPHPAIPEYYVRLAVTDAEQWAGQTALPLENAPSAREALFLAWSDGGSLLSDLEYLCRQITAHNADPNRTIEAKLMKTAHSLLRAGTGNAWKPADLVSDPA